MTMVSGLMGGSEMGRKRRFQFAGLTGAVVLLVIASMWLLPESGGDAVARSEASAPTARIDGFRTAQFGSDEKAVRAAIAADIGTTDAAIKLIDNPVERTRILVVRSDKLFTGSTEAEIGYVFGYKSKTLIQVNILWGTPLTPEVTRSQLATIAATLTRYFTAQGFAADRVLRDRKLGKDGLLIFQGADAAGHMVQLVQRQEAAKADSEKMRMTLRLAYIADPKQPDIFRIAKGAF
jgi:hypothetical protein